MAIYHLHVKNISRRDGRSAVAAAAYRAGETLPNEAEAKDSAFGGRGHVVFTDIHLPSTAPAWMADRAKLWNAVEAAEKRKDARLARMPLRFRSATPILIGSPRVRTGWTGSTRHLRRLPPVSREVMIDWTGVFCGPRNTDIRKSRIVNINGTSRRRAKLQFSE